MAFRIRPRWALPLVLVVLALPLGEPNLLARKVALTPPTGAGPAVPRPFPPALAPLADRMPVSRPVLVPETLRPGDLGWPLAGSVALSTLQKVRGDIGRRANPADFTGPLRGTVELDDTPFGKNLQVNLFVNWSGARVAVSLWNQVNAVGYFPGVDVQLVEVPLSNGKNPILFTPHLGLWAQPRGLKADSAAWDWGAMGALNFEFPIEDNLWVWVEGRTKTLGWMAGADVAPDLTVRTGLHWSL
jgi:hypothetical protein